MSGQDPHIGDLLNVPELFTTPPSPDGFRPNIGQAVDLIDMDPDIDVDCNHDNVTRDDVTKAVLGAVSGLATLGNLVSTLPTRDEVRHDVEESIQNTELLVPVIEKLLVGPLRPTIQAIVSDIMGQATHANPKELEELAAPTRAEANPKEPDNLAAPTRAEAAKAPTVPPRLTPVGAPTTRHSGRFGRSFNLQYAAAVARAPNPTVPAAAAVTTRNAVTAPDTAGRVASSAVRATLDGNARETYSELAAKRIVGERTNPPPTMINLYVPLGSTAPDHKLKPSDYGSNIHFDGGFCFEELCTRKICKYGASCAFRHDPPTFEEAVYMIQCGGERRLRTMASILRQKYPRTCPVLAATCLRATQPSAREKRPLVKVQWSKAVQEDMSQTLWTLWQYRDRMGLEGVPRAPAESPAISHHRATPIASESAVAGDVSEVVHDATIETTHEEYGLGCSGRY